jgi:hypothetical protein
METASMGGIERRHAPELLGTWRAVVPGDEVVRLPDLGPAEDALGR